MTPTRTTDRTEPDQQSTTRRALPSPMQVLLVLVTVSLVATPVAAQEDGAPGGAAAQQLCENETLSNLLSGVFSLLTAGGLIGGVLAYKWQAIARALSVNPRQQERLSERKHQIRSGVFTVLAIDVLYVVAAQMTGLPTFGCVF